MQLFEFAAGNARREFQPRAQAQRIDPSGWAEDKITDAANDLIFSANEARLAGDVDTLLKIQHMAERLGLHLKTVETLAIDLADRVLKERGVK